MKPELLKILCCPDCKGDLSLSEARESAGEIEQGQLVCGACARRYPIIDFVPRFVHAENYANNFGFQWNKFRSTQLDSHTGLPLSRERFFESTGWLPEELKGQKALDIGCGAGRFAEVALSTGAEVIALDYSSAVEACWKNLSPNPRLNVVQGDIYKLPFKKETFDFVYCLGVLQHTPDVEKAFLALPDQVRRGGKLAVDVYPKLRGNMHFLWPKYWIRPVTKRMSQERLFKLVLGMVKFLLPVSLVIGRIPVVGRKLRYAIPVANHEPDWPLNKTQVKEWAILNTYDMLAPAHDYPQSAQTLRSWFQQAGLRDLEVFRAGHLIGRGVKP